MIACREADAITGHVDDFSWIPQGLSDTQLNEAVPTNWNYEILQDTLFESEVYNPELEETVFIESKDCITNAPELVRLTGNIALTHTDPTSSYTKRRLVYGGHTIALAFAQILRAFPNLVTILGWQGCDHLAPVNEEDVIKSEFIVKKMRRHSEGNIIELTCSSYVVGNALNVDKDYSPVKVLKWDLVIFSV